jgi:hypothetical protein
MKLPGFMFYPGDWQKDPDLKRCSHAAKGVWMDVLCLAFELPERGVLVSNGRPWTERELAEAVGGNPDVALRVVQELISKGVIKRREDGAMFCRRMVKDEEVRRKRAEGGKLGGNPQLIGQTEAKVNLPPNLTTNHRVILPPEYENEKKEIGGCKGEQPVLKLDAPEPDLDLDALAAEIYDLYPLKVKRPRAIVAIKKALKKTPSDKLRELTAAYAKRIKETGYAYVPHPATWFNDECYNDSPDTWVPYVNVQNGGIEVIERKRMQQLADDLYYPYDREKHPEKVKELETLKRKYACP